MDMLLPRLTVEALGAVAIVLSATCAVPQDLPTLSVSPSKVNMLAGETRVFRAVGKDGRLRQHVHWSIAPPHAATLSENGDEATVKAVEPSSHVVLTANVQGDAAEAEIDILAEHAPPTGTVLWSVAPIPGCKSEKLTQAVPSANGPDLYDQESCPQGSIIRALTADGRELWRRVFNGAGLVPEETAPGAAAAEPVQRLQPLHRSVCDAISAGMTKAQAVKILADRHLPVDEKQRKGDQWLVEEEGFQCEISFDAGNGTVVKKKKTVVTD